MDASRERITRVYEQVTSSIDELIGMLTPADWGRGTDCTAWSVKDIIGHLGAFEAIASGIATHAADADVSAHAHAIGFNETIERDVEARRSWTPDRVATEFRDATLKRGEALRGMTDEVYAAASMPSPFGDVPTERFMPIRIIDLYFHEQDVRRATGNPGHLDGEVARFCFERMREGLPAVLGKKVGLEDPQTVVLNLTSHAGTTIAFGANADGRIEDVHAIPKDPTVRITCDLERFLMLTGGRGDWRHHVKDGSVTLTGDIPLGEKILEQIVVTP